ncbi:hypothetical protein PaeBR_18015 [Paenibacillus sp. BR2-3]|uniref:hypothetical protein n=1 Tax=Paenibacillus sp. BR2-3 TaxID=3048494 RepID=UPI0039776454
MKAPIKRTPLSSKALIAKKALMAKKVKAAAPRKRRRIRQTLDRFIVLATNLAATPVPRDTTGWSASLTTGGTTVTADFDDFGVVRFPTISTLTTVSYTLRIRNAEDVVLVTRTVPADREFYVARF